MLAFDFTDRSMGVTVRSKSSQLDYSKRAIMQFLKVEYGLRGVVLTEKVNVIYNYLLNNRDFINKEIVIDLKGNLELKKIPVVRGFDNDVKLTRSGVVIKQINFILTCFCLAINIVYEFKGSLNGYK